MATVNSDRENLEKVLKIAKRETLSDANWRFSHDISVVNRKQFAAILSAVQ